MDVNIQCCKWLTVSRAMATGRPEGSAVANRYNVSKFKSFRMYNRHTCDHFPGVVDHTLVVLILAVGEVHPDCSNERRLR